MIQRIFIAAGLPETLSAKLARIPDKYQIPVSWVPADNLHLTVLFLGAVRSENLYQIIREVEQAVKDRPSFTLKFNRVEYGPDDSLPPRLVWLLGEKNSQFEEMRDEIDRRLKKENLYYLTNQSKESKIHITLGRVKKWEWARLEADSRLPIREELVAEMPIDELLIMESKLSPGRPPQYFILEKIPLKKS